MSNSFTHLHIHTEYSLVNSIISIPRLIKTAKNYGYTTLAITDTFNIFGAIKFYKTAIKHGIKPIIGCEVMIFEQGQTSRLVFLAQNNMGYLNLKSLISKSYLEGQKHRTPTIDKSWLNPQNTNGLIALSAGRAGDIGNHIIKGNIEKATNCAQFWQTLLGDRFYIELIRTNREYEDLVTTESIAIAAKLQIPITASNDVQFLKPDDFEAHEARVCIGQGTTLADPKRDRLFTSNQFLTSAEQMWEKFADMPVALENANEIAKRCTATIELGITCLPDYPIPNGMNEVDFFAEVSNNGLQIRLIQLFPEASERTKNMPLYQERLDMELSVINKMGFPGYFLIVADFIRWTKEQNIPVGPGRGSGAGSLVAYALNITNIDPIKYELLFERFLNPERVSMPDFDIDFCMDKRDLVIEYVSQKYGKDRVSQIITYGNMNARSVVRDVARVLGYPYAVGDRISKMIPFDLGMTLEKALKESSELYERYQLGGEDQEVIDLSRSLEGLKRNVGTHAAGVVISPSDINHFTPIYCEDNDGELVTQFDKDDAEEVGLVKFDFLGLRTLTVMDWALANIRALDPDNIIDLDAIPLNDPQVYQLLQNGQTTAVFQMESPGLQRMLKELKPNEFEDIVAAVALYRPGPLEMGMDATYINRKHGKEDVAYPHPDLQETLKPTYGVIVYQEQVMQIARILANFSLGEADNLRRAMGKKKADEMATMRVKFESGAKARGVNINTARDVFDLMETFANYGFNKSHSAAYAYIGYQTAWLKIHYPSQYMAAVLSSEMNNTNGVVGLIAESRTLGLEILPPNINQSHHPFTAINDKQIVYGLGAIKGVGEAAIKHIISGRTDSDYHSLFDFCFRVDTSSVNKRTIEALIGSGAFDCLMEKENFEPSFQARATLLHNLTDAVKSAEQRQHDNQSGQEDMFSNDMDESQRLQSYQLVAPWSESERLFKERDMLGLFLTGHPIDEHHDWLNNIITHRISDLDSRLSNICIAGLVIEVFIGDTKKGNKRMSIKLDDKSGQIEIGLFGEKANNFADMIKKDSIWVINGFTRVDDFRGGFQVSVQTLQTLEATKIERTDRIEVSYASSEQADASALERMLTPHKNGHCAIGIKYQNAESQAELWLPKPYRITPSDALINDLKGVSWIDSVKIFYR